MSSRAGSGEAAKPGGIYDRIGDFVVRWPLVVIAAWIALAAALFLLFPPLQVQAGKHPPSPFPEDAPTAVIGKEMAKAWSVNPDGKKDEKAEAPAAASATSLLMVLLTNEKGLTPSDYTVYQKLIDKLNDDKQDKLSVQNAMNDPEMKNLLVAKDGKALILPLNVPGDQSDPGTIAAYKRIAAIVKQTVAGTTLTANLSGPLATVVDLTDIGQEDIHFIEIATVVSVLIILIIIYRNVVTMFVPLATIGISVGTAQGVLSGAAELGLATNLQVIVFMTAVMMGAGTDYAVFLISRYHDYLRQGDESDVAVKKALMSIGKVIAASAATVAVTFLAMIFTKLEVFSAVGPAISISIVISLLAAVTFLPAVLVLTGRRGWINPRRDLTTRMWRLSGIRIVRRPKIHLIASLIVLIALAACVSVVRFNYDDLKSLPDDVDSSKGYDAMTRHFPLNGLTPMVLFIQSSRDLRTPQALADLEQVAARVSQLPNITMVRGLTRPNGDPLEQMKVSWQAGEVGGKLDEASSQIANHGDDLDKLVNGSNQLADALAQLRDQVTQSVSNLSGVVSALTAMEQLLGGDRTIAALDQGASFTGQMKSLGQNLGSSTANAQNIAQWGGPMLTALNNSPDCNADPSCVSSRASLAAIVGANNDGTLNSLKIMSRNLQAAGQAATIAQTLDKVQQTLTQASDAMKTIKNLQATMAAAQQGSNMLADGSRAIAGGVKELVDQTRRLGAGLNEASSFLLNMKHDASQANMSGFNLPPEITTRDEYKKGAQIFISPDGHAARYFIQSGLSPFTTDAMDQVSAIERAARSATANTELTDAKIAVAGVPTGLRDTRDYYNSDIGFIIVATIVIVFLILVILLRAIIAPLYLIASVLLSYLSAVGIGVLVFQFLMGKELHWSLPGLSFILLVAVGADYNMLLISRIRDESPHGVRVGVIRTVGTTGGVITSAGLIFAASMFGLLFASISTMAEAGFIIGIGIVVDTFLVRTITVPALAAMIGQKNWWPSNLGKSPSQVYAAYQAKQRQLEQISGQLVRLKVIPSPKTQVLPAAGPAADSKKPTKGSVDLNRDHPLPLFDLSGVSHLTDLKEAQAPTRPNGNTRHKPDRFLGHSLPLFGHNVLASRPILLVANGNGHKNGKTNGHANDNSSPEEDASQPLPVFGGDERSVD
ncbi:putative transport protein MmpL12 [Mycobacterium saskatchewanense]|uniref:MMPL/RND family transporter n=1 Tax=Mycobacterium saskatchewanense TaxID=220927 RepID=UPI000A150B95|nr:RND family transporter [Mycobacterium saskatchewanense]BBX61132.1 putative transport protein MmpL12 [Mycobacterium saskatchewanense]